MPEEELKTILSQNGQIKEILAIIALLGLPDTWLCAGTVRNFVWNYLSGNQTLDDTNDVDVVFFDKGISYAETLQLEQKLKEKYPQYNWELKNEVYMHGHSPETAPYQNSYDAVAKFPETCTAIAIRLNEQQLELMAPHGIVDLTNFIVRPTPHFRASATRRQLYQERVKKKNWQARWPKIQVLDR